MPDTPLILVAEDRGIVAAKVARDLRAVGFGVAGPVATVAAASRLAAREPDEPGSGRPGLAGAVLDIDLRGEPSFPVADLLRARGVPVLFLTGYSRVALPETWRDAPLLEKPFDAGALARALERALAGDRATPDERRAVTPAIRRAWDRVRHARDLVTEQRAWTEQSGLGRA